MTRPGGIGTVALALALLWTPSGAQQPLDRDARLEAVQKEIDRLENELRSLGAREQGLLDALERLRTESRLREAQSERVELEIEEVREAVRVRSEKLADIEQSQEARRKYLAFRLREIYKQGPQQTLRRMLSGEALDEYLDGMRYAAFLSARDARVLAAYRDDALHLNQEREQLSSRQAELERLDRELSRTRRELERARREREAALREVREDSGKREAAITELEGAATDLGRLADSFLPGSEPPPIDVRKFRGLLDWPAEGQVSAEFGTVIHPRFKTRVPHPGLDIDAPEGARIQSVFDGQVVFASWMRGYGLTVIVDHGEGLVSIYAHAAALLVEPGEAVLRGQTVGMVGETGSLRGPYLYFELRQDGNPVDPRSWLRSR